jgi:hypothetical protein
MLPPVPVMMQTFPDNLEDILSSPWLRLVMLATARLRARLSAVSMRRSPN